ncbi:MAG: response regulator [Bdellovibrionales bacterium]|nr:response regulator [Bdellovibrionales bacterium]
MKNARIDSYVFFIISEMAGARVPLTDSSNNIGAGTSCEKIQDLYHYLQYIPSMVFVTDLDANITFINKTIPPYKPEEVVGTNVFDYARPDDVMLIKEAFQRAIHTGQITTYESGTSAGLPFTWFAAQVKPLFGNGRVSHLLVLLTEITDRRKAELALQESQSRYEEIASNIPGMVYQFFRSKKGRYRLVFASARVWDIFQVTRADALRNISKIFRRIHQDDLKDFFQSIETSYQQVSSWKAEFRIILPNNNIRWLRGSSSPRKSAGGHTLWNGVLIDITTEKNNEEKRLLLEKQLQQNQKMEALGTLARGIAHDFNNFLQIISMSIELAEQDKTLGEKSKVYLGKALSACVRGRQLIHQILSYSRNEEIEKTSFDLSAITCDFVSMIRSSIPSHIVFDSSIEPFLTVHGSISQIQQVLLNLMTNSLYALKGGEGHLRINLSQIQIGSEDSKDLRLPSGHYAELLVVDNGLGINPNEVERIFDPFFTTKPEEEGSGLGLFVTLGIVKSHGGDIYVKSLPYKETCFRVLLPLQPTDMPNRDFNLSQLNRQSADTADDSKARLLKENLVLLVDDDKDLLDLQTVALKEMGYQVMSCFTGNQALEILRHKLSQVKLVITDYSLNGMSGIELLKEIQNLCPEVPTILTSGHSAEELKSQARSIGIQLHCTLPKPYTSKELRTSISRSFKV